MHDVLKQGYVKARKDHNGEGSDYFDFANKKGGYDLKEFKDLGMTDEDIKAVQDAKSRNWKIFIGELYYCQTGVYDGDMYTYRVIKDIHAILIKHDLYRED